MVTKQTLGTERDFQRSVIEYAKLGGWLTAHFDASVRVVNRGGSKVFVGDSGSSGFPDLFAVRATRIVVAEFKQVKRYPTPTQREWLDALADTAAEVYLWRPTEHDWQEIQEVLA